MDNFNSYDCSNLNFAYLGACNSAYADNNAAKAIVNHGAKAALGYKKSVSYKV